MAKARKGARKATRKTARKPAKRTIKVKGSSARGVKRKTPVKRVKASKSVVGRVVDAVREAASLRSRLTGHDTFED